MSGRIVVLVTEDEAFVRMAAVEALRGAEFDVIEAEHAEGALRVLEVQAAIIKVLFTDIHMPGTMDGLALAHHTARSWPWIALLIASGRPRAHGTVLPAKSRFLEKPYCHDHVVSHIRELAVS